MSEIASSACGVAVYATLVEGRTAHGASASIEQHFDEVMSAAHLLREEQLAQGADVIVIARFDGPAIGACREIADGPVLGICEASIKAASMIATTLPRSVLVIEELVRRYGLDHKCRRVQSAEVPVLALEERGSNVRQLARADILRGYVQPVRLAERGDQHPSHRRRNGCHQIRRSSDQG